ncbi:MAG: tRNA (adenosine(37)-N6)-threonylcarbamoyltransferase complex transferase subunit TsaD [Saprospiraceae bacterium]
MREKIIILAIESSCDDTSAAVIENGLVLSNCTATQDIHHQYGGVIPEVASRQHQQNIVVVVQAAIEKSGIDLHEISAVAFTRGPGLLGSLLVGVSFAKSFALSLDIPLIEVHHMQAHALAHFATDRIPSFPFLCLTVSGGHTQLVLIKDFLEMDILGQTLDDAAGEAFDKVGKLLGLPYPAGPLVDKLAKNGLPKFQFPIAQIPDLNFSFSGFKTAVLYFLQKRVSENKDFITENIEDICASVQKTIIDTLMLKLNAAVQLYPTDDIAIAGGVSANSGLRYAFEEYGNKIGKRTFIPPFEYCTDNAAMIGITGYYKYLNHQFASLEISPDPRLSITTF